MGLLEKLPAVAAIASLYGSSEVALDRALRRVRDFVRRARGRVQALGGG